MGLCLVLVLARDAAATQGAGGGVAPGIRGALDGLSRRLPARLMRAGRLGPTGLIRSTPGLKRPDRRPTLGLVEQRRQRDTTLQRLRRGLDGRLADGARPARAERARVLRPDALRQLDRSLRRTTERLRSGLRATHAVIASQLPEMAALVDRYLAASPTDQPALLDRIAAFRTHLEARLSDARRRGASVMGTVMAALDRVVTLRSLGQRLHVVPVGRGGALRAMGASL